MKSFRCVKYLKGSNKSILVCLRIKECIGRQSLSCEEDLPSHSTPQVSNLYFCKVPHSFRHQMGPRLPSKDMKPLIHLPSTNNCPSFPNLSNSENSQIRAQSHLFSHLGLRQALHPFSRIYRHSQQLTSPLGFLMTCNTFLCALTESNHTRISLEKNTLLDCM